MSILDRFFGPSYAKELKTIKPLINKVNSLEAELSPLSLDGLKEKTESLKSRIKGGESVDSILPEAFALVRESAKRTLGLRHYDVQLIGGALLHRGKITEMRTGEGKTLVGTLPAYLNALSGEGVHIITVNDYLARRDAVWMGQVYVALGLSVGVINHDASYLYDESHSESDAQRDQEGSFKVHYEFLRPCTRKEAYLADVTYGTNSEFGFDYLRDNIEFEADKIRQRGHKYAIVDEIDSILIDEARTPLIISAPAATGADLYTTFSRIASRLAPEEHYLVDEKHKSATLTDAGVEEAEKMLGIDNIYTDKGIKYVHHLETAVRAKALYTRDKEYVVRDGEVVIVDEFTGRLQPGRRWSDGLHQAVEAKEGVTIQRESRTYASITYQNYFRMYDKLSGMTGTALTSSEEFYTVYGLEVVPVPTNKDVVRIDKNDLIFQTEKGKFAAIARKVKEVNSTGQPLLIGSASIDKNELLSAELHKEGIKHEILNAKNHEREGEIIAEAGRKGAVTLATNMAGRGVDIKLGGATATPEETEEVRGLGGLFVLGTERHEARRIDNQLRGRSGRQGDPGETQFYVSMEDSLMRVFGGDRIKSLMGSFGIPEDQPIENRMLNKQLEAAQTRIEGFHFDARKQVLAYDDVINKQRQVIYARRSRLLLGDEAEVNQMLSEVTDLLPETADILEKKKAEFGDAAWSEIIRKLFLQVTDIIWVEHLEVMNYTRSSVTLRAYGQRDPLIEYRKEAARLFREMQESTLRRVAEILPNIQPEAIAKEEEELKRVAKAAQATGGKSDTNKKGPRTSDKTYGRNDVVKITNGTDVKEMKFKKAESLLDSGEWKLVTN
ncbi:preprotein translocase subunit SecA [Candidatus Kaiserbacteria bacterium CG10_big_fil_rev_8_21_14_0_10_44_10]|uniref:Protein translocase subunit SecA n=1 Tax=Candidatus Kaiserbacteria bacterium CG10_big_fil_rev_8_21_14_0_10_44_10 TaxID=1974606 RepID=A0A2H0UI42_9BACT|nr:MAG: preprotein translocase subunit SecA [Candidatus Kaiserbacteria bacterium CG10_big_fil_rev_8_21_14_0_10_44_10]